MRLLTEYTTVQAVDVATLSAILPIAGDNTPPAAAENVAAPQSEPVDNRNLNLARQVEQHKTELIDILSSFPLTAYWLLEKYGSSTDNDESDEDFSSATGVQDFLKPVKNYFQLLISPVGHEIKTEGFNVRQELKSSVSLFPFSFHDLKNLTDLVLSLAGYENHNSDEDSQVDAKAREIIRKRLANCKNHGLNAIFSANEIVSNNLDLVLPPDNLKKQVSRLVLAEHYWLFYRQQLAIVNGKLVLFIANQYKGSFLDFEDLVQEGQSGLLKAVDRFKYQLGFQFSTYAGYWIRQAISRALSRSERVVRIPCGQIATINRVFRAKDELLLKSGREPDVHELAEYTHLSDEDVHNIMAISQSSVPLETFDDEEDDNAFAPIDFIEQHTFRHSSDMMAEKQLGNLVRKAVKTLNSREEKIISSHFGVDSDEQKTLQQIGTELNLTRERVRQIQVVALKKIRHRYGEQLLSFL